jgi:hypothetical protein
MQSGGAARATATALIAITATAIDVLIVRMVVRMGMSRELLHYARSATVAEVSSPFRPRRLCTSHYCIVTDSDQHPLRLDVIFG